MENSILLDIWIIVWSILGIILFFKIWGATNTIDEICQLLRDMNAGQGARPIKPVEVKTERFPAGALVVDSTQQQYRVVRDDGDTVVVKSTLTGEQTFRSTELRPFAPPKSETGTDKVILYGLLVFIVLVILVALFAN